MRVSCVNQMAEGRLFSVGVECYAAIAASSPAFKHSEAFSFQIATDDQAETDR